MKSYQVIEWGKPLEERHYRTPEPSGTEVLLKVTVCGVCHSDLHIHSGYFDKGGKGEVNLSDRGVKLPLTLGHEPVGVVVAVGPEIKDAHKAGVPLGATRVVWPWVGCRKCEACLREEDILCENGRYLGARVDGGYSDFMLIPHPRYLLPFDGVEPEVVATYACAGITGYSAVKRALTTYPEEFGTLGKIDKTDTILIIGAGGVGLNALSVARAITNAKIVVADLDSNKRQLALDNGADQVIDSSDPEGARQLREITNSGISASIDFVGRSETSRFAIDALRRGGVHVVVGLFGGTVEIPTSNYIYRLLSIRGSHLGTPQDLKELIDLRRKGKIMPPPIKSRPMSEVNAVFGELNAGKVDGRITLVP